MDPKQLPAGTRDTMGGCRGLFFGLSLLGLLPGVLQPLSWAQDVSRSPDQEWAELKAAAEPKATALLQPSADVMDRVRAREQRIADYVRQADQLRVFRQSNPNHPEINEAKRLEALNLLYAAYAGDHTQERRRAALVAEVRSNLEIPARLRSSVAAYAENLEVRRQSGLSQSERVAAFGHVARRLIAEFPDVPETYGSLLNVAMSSNETQAARIAEDLLQMPGAPARIKEQARDLKERCALIGRSLADVVTEVIGPDNVFEQARGRRVILYTWSTEDPRSVRAAQQIAKQAPADAVVIGFNVDLDLAGARSAAAEYGLPGDQVHMVEGYGGAIAQVLRAGRSGLIYTTNEHGVVVSTMPNRPLADALNMVGNTEPDEAN